jgi:hypothetical protein
MASEQLYYGQSDAMDMNLTVFEEDAGYFTGLYDHLGRPIHNVTERVPVGFHRNG